MVKNYTLDWITYTYNFSEIGLVIKEIGLLILGKNQ